MATVSTLINRHIAASDKLENAPMPLADEDLDRLADIADAARATPSFGSTPNNTLVATAALRSEEATIRSPKLFLPRSTLRGVVAEAFSRQEKYEVLTAAQWLARFNSAALKAGGAK